MNIVWTAIWFILISGILGVALAFAAKVFAVKTDERVEKIIEVLPGANCGGCGYTGCASLAEAIVSGAAGVSSCPVGGAETSGKISGIMAIPLSESSLYRAQVMCSGTSSLSKQKYEYMGIKDCISASRLSGGAKTCPNGCLGFGTCVKNCKFDAIHIINGVAAVDYNKCKACGICTSACPKKIIKLIPYTATHWVGCMSFDKGAVTRKYCDIGCIGCRICEKKCEAGAIKINESVASIDYSKCTGCGECEKACPRRIIWSNKTQADEGIIIEKEQSVLS